MSVNRCARSFFLCPGMIWRDFILRERRQTITVFLSKGVTVRKTIDVIIGTFCVEHDLMLIHNDRDFTLMAPHIGLTFAGKNSLL